MFGRNQHDLLETLASMEKEARVTSNFNQAVARERFKEFLSQDQRFSEFDPDELVSRTMFCRNNGAQLDLSDPRLRPGGEARPLERNRWR